MNEVSHWPLIRNSLSNTWIKEMSEHNTQYYFTLYVKSIWNRHIEYFTEIITYLCYTKINNF